MSIQILKFDRNTKFTGIEIHGCIEKDDNVQQVDHDPSIKSEFWSVYFRLQDGTLDCISDCDTKDEAYIAREIIAVYCDPASQHPALPSQEDMAAALRALYYSCLSNDDTSERAKEEAKRILDHFPTQKVTSLPNPLSDTEIQHFRVDFDNKADFIRQLVWLAYIRYVETNEAKFIEALNDFMAYGGHMDTATIVHDTDIDIYDFKSFFENIWPLIDKSNTSLTHKFRAPQKS